MLLGIQKCLLTALRIRDFFKYAKHIGIARAFCLSGWTEKIAGLWFVRGGISSEADTMH